MEYAIQTLEIEIARIQQALRLARSTTQTYQDIENGGAVDYRGLESNISQLKAAIQTLKQWEIDNPVPEGHLRQW